MSDQTSIFTTCVQIYEQDYKEKIKEDKTHEPKEIEKLHKAHSALTTMDSLVMEAVKLNKTIISLDGFLSEIKTFYLLSSAGSSSNKAINSERQKDEIDSTMQIKLQGLSTQLKKMEEYERKRVELEKLNESAVSISKVAMNFISRGNYEDYQLLEATTINLFRANILKYLSVNLKNLSTTFLDMKEKRLERKREFNKSSLATNTSYRNDSHNDFNDYTPSSNADIDNRNNTDQHIPLISEKDEQSYKETMSGLGQQELLLLQKENEELLLESKSEELSKVKHLETSIIDVAQIINEIGFQLDVQNDQINQLMDTQEDVVNNITSGNTELKKANERSSNNAKRVTWLIIILGLFLVFFDYML